MALARRSLTYRAALRDPRGRRRLPGALATRTRRCLRPATSAAVPAIRQIDAAAASGSMFAPVMGRIGLAFESAGTTEADSRSFSGALPFCGLPPIGGALPRCGAPPIWGVPPIGGAFPLPGVAADVHEHAGVGGGVLMHWQVGVAVAVLMQEPHVADGVGMLPHWQFGCVWGTLLPPMSPLPDGIPVMGAAPASQLAAPMPSAAMAFSQASV